MRFKFPVTVGFSCLAARCDGRSNISFGSEDQIELHVQYDQEDLHFWTQIRNIYLHFIGTFFLEVWSCDRAASERLSTPPPPPHPPTPLSHQSRNM